MINIIQVQGRNINNNNNNINNNINHKNINNHNHNSNEKKGISVYLQDKLIKEKIGPVSQVENILRKA